MIKSFRSDGVLTKLIGKKRQMRIRCHNRLFIFYFVFEEALENMGGLDIFPVNLRFLFNKGGEAVLGVVNDRAGVSTFPIENRALISSCFSVLGA